MRLWSGPGGYFVTCRRRRATRYVTTRSAGRWDVPLRRGRVQPVPQKSQPVQPMRCASPGGAEVDVAVLFADVRGSIVLGRRHDAADFSGCSTAFYATATQTLLRNDALIDKLIGDEVMAIVRGISGPQYRRRAVLAGHGAAAGRRLRAGRGTPVAAGPRGQRGRCLRRQRRRDGGRLNRAGRSGVPLDPDTTARRRRGVARRGWGGGRPDARCLQFRGYDRPVEAFALRA